MLASKYTTVTRGSAVNIHLGIVLLGFFSSPIMHKRARSDLGKDYLLNLSLKLYVCQVLNYILSIPSATTPTPTQRPTTAQ